MRIALFALVFAFAPAAHAQSLDELAWLVGCWRTDAPAEAETGAQVTEVWAAPPMPAILGYSYTWGEGEVQGWEQMRIEMTDGWPHFVAMPNGGAPVRFRMVEPDAPGRRAAAFLNPDHDYPQRVVYQRKGADLLATISLADGTEPVQFRYRRIDCGAALSP